MSDSDATRLVGLWEQVGSLDHATGAARPWPEGSLNASVREVFRFFADGTCVFGRFLRDAEVSFDDERREFVSGLPPDKILRGRWSLKKRRLTQWFEVPGHAPQVHVVELAELTDERFVVNEKTPVPGLVLPVVYRRLTPAEAAPLPAGGAPAETPINVPPPNEVAARRPWWKFWIRRAVPPLDAGRTELVELLREARALLARPGNDFSCSSWPDADAALSELDRLIEAIESGTLPARADLTVLFLPTGPVQEVSLSSGWGDDFVYVARRIDRAVQRVYG